jgi:type II secretory pathway pseudopilin PulG
MLATVAALVILLGLMVSLARYVRRQASDQLTKQLLAQLDVLVRNYQTRYKALPAVTPFVSGIQTDEQQGRRGEGEKGGAQSRPATSPLLPIAPSPLLPVFAEEALPDEATLRAAAEANNRSFVQALQVEARRYPTEYAGLPTSFFVEGVLPDAWGTPIVFMPALHPAIGMAMENRPFLLSAGPDRRFRTLEDNLYSYEVGEETTTVPVQR